MNNDERAIRNLVAEWNRATAAGDVETILGLMAEDVIFLVAGQPPMKGRGTFERAMREILSSHRFESTFEIQDVEVSGDLAYCWTTLAVRILSRSGDGDPMTRSGNTLSVLRKQADGAWVIVRDANLMVATG